MRRADRLYQITLFLRSRPLTTAHWLAEQLRVSDRTIYRDIADLMCTGLDIEGEAGVGYRLQQRDELPPLTFSAIELDALRLGCRLVAMRTDDELASAARLAQARIEAALQQAGQPQTTTLLFAPPMRDKSQLVKLGQLRRAASHRQIVTISYQRADGQSSTRRIHPLGLFYWESVWTLAAWCEQRNDYRHFRLDRISALDVHTEYFPSVPGRSLSAYLQQEGIRPQQLG